MDISDNSFFREFSCLDGVGAGSSCEVEQTALDQ